jgi:hypothetical protein
MINQFLKRKSVLLFAAAILVTACVIGGAVISARRQQPKKQLHPKDWLVSIPPVSSKIRDLEIINARIVGPGSDMPGVAFEIRNNLDRAVMAVSITCGGPSITKDGLDDEDHPIVVIEPHGVLTAEMNDELTPDAPIVISAATFDDGTEEGSESSLKLMRAMRAHERARRKSQKEQGSPGRRPNPWVSFGRVIAIGHGFRLPPGSSILRRLLAIPVRGL